MRIQVVHTSYRMAFLSFINEMINLISKSHIKLVPYVLLGDKDFVLASEYEESVIYGASKILKFDRNFYFGILNKHPAIIRCFREHILADRERVLVTVKAGEGREVLGRF